MSTEIQEQVFAFIRETVSEPEAKIEMGMEVEVEFGLASLDTICFYDEFLTRFNVEIPEDIEPHPFPDGVPVTTRIRALFSKEIREKIRFKEVTVRHLVQVATTKKWTWEIE